MLNLKRDQAPGAKLDWVEAPVNYLADLKVKPVTYNPPAGTGVPRREGRLRTLARPPGLHPDAPRHQGAQFLR